LIQILLPFSDSLANDGIADTGLNLEGYTLFRKDRVLDIKGGGVLLYVKEVFSAREVKLNNQFPQQVWCNYSGNQSINQNSLSSRTTSRLIIKLTHDDVRV